MRIGIGQQDPFVARVHVRPGMVPYLSLGKIGCFADLVSLFNRGLGLKQINSPGLAESITGEIGIGEGNSRLLAGVESLLLQAAPLRAEVRSV